MMKRLVTILLLAWPALAFGQAEVEVRDEDISGDVVWTSDNTYILIDRVYVEDGESLTIEPGTVIKGRASANPEDAAALIVARGGKIYADGTAAQPILFTAEADDVDDPSDLGPSDRGLWGGVIILGRASVNTADGTNNIEGIDATDPRTVYGGGDAPDDEDDSGVFRYVSIRHGGAELAPNDEINGLTLGGVGRGTTVEYVEVFANLDDGFEWFGGTVNTRYLVAAFCGDDGFDYDEGWRGHNQFWFLIQGTDDAGSGGEHDGGTDPEDGQPYAMPLIYNATYIGPGADAAVGDLAVNLRDNAGGQYHNAIFTAFPEIAVQVEDLASGEDSWARFQAGELAFTHNIFHDFGAGTEPEALFTVVNSDGNETAAKAAFVAYMSDAAQANQITDPMLMGISRTTDGGLDPRPASGSPALTSAVAEVPEGGFFTQTSYLGAFGSDDLWLHGWTALSAYGVTPQDASTPVEDGGELPHAVVLEQNYPNPFNPQTTIEYRLDQAQRVKLAVHDLLGREVAVLVDGLEPAGTYRVPFDASDLSSGLYVYQLRTEGGLATRVMTLVK